MPRYSHFYWLLDQKCYEASKCLLRRGILPVCVPSDPATAKHWCRVFNWYGVTECETQQELANSASDLDGVWDIGSVHPQNDHWVVTLDEDFAAVAR